MRWKLSSFFSAFMGALFCIWQRGRENRWASRGLREASLALRIHLHGHTFLVCRLSQDAAPLMRSYTAWPCVCPSLHTADHSHLTQLQLLTCSSDRATSLLCKFSVSHFHFCVSSWSAGIWQMLIKWILPAALQFTQPGSLSSAATQFSTRNSSWLPQQRNTCLPRYVGSLDLPLSLIPSFLIKDPILICSSCLHTLDAWSLRFSSRALAHTGGAATTQGVFQNYGVRHGMNDYCRAGEMTPLSSLADT